MEQQVARHAGRPAKEHQRPARPCPAGDQGNRWGPGSPSTEGTGDSGACSGDPEAPSLGKRSAGPDTLRHITSVHGCGHTALPPRPRAGPCLQGHEAQPGLPTRPDTTLGQQAAQEWPSSLKGQQAVFSHGWLPRPAVTCPRCLLLLPPLAKHPGLHDPSPWTAADRSVCGTEHVAR